jgi:hypothetical protein
MLLKTRCWQERNENVEIRKENTEPIHLNSFFIMENPQKKKDDLCVIIYHKKNSFFFATLNVCRQRENGI